MTGTADTVSELAGSRLDGLRFVLPGAYATAFAVIAADATRLLPFEERHLRPEWLVVGLLASFLLGYTLHLVAIRQTSRRNLKAQVEDLSEAVDSALMGKRRRRRVRPRGPHDVVNVLQSSSTLQWAGVRPLVLAKFNRLTGYKASLADLDTDDKLRWFVYHFCYSYILKTGAAEEARNSRAQFEMVRTFCVSLWFGFGAAIVSLPALILRALLSGSIKVWGESPILVALILFGLATPFLFGGLLREQQDRTSKRLAGAVYEAFLAAN